MTATAYICYEDGTPSEAQTFTSVEELAKALCDAVTMHDTRVRGDLEVREFHCTFINPKYLPPKENTWDKFKEQYYLKNKDKEEFRYPVNPCVSTGGCTGKCKSNNKGSYYDDSMSEYCERDFEV